MDQDQKQFTKQETFDLSVGGILKQGGPSRLKNPITQIFGTCSCAYRGEDGRKCAAGQLIPDDKYDQSMEGEACISDKLRVVLAGHEEYLLLALQRAHDHLAKLSDEGFLPHFRQEAEEIAAECLLATTVLDQAVAS